MPNSSNPITITQDSAATTGNPVRWNYGYVWATGDRLGYIKLQNTQSNPQTSGLPNAGNTLNWTCVGFWALGEGEMDGCTLLNINGQRAYNSEFDDLTTFHFHRGTDGVLGSGFALTSQGPDQGVDTFWLYMPGVAPSSSSPTPSGCVVPLPYSRIAYYSLFLKWPSLYNQYAGQNPPKSDNNGNNWADLNPIGLWRGLRCRQFDANGNQIGYAFTVNPVWHWVDQWIRRRIKPDYTLTMSGPEALTASELACFDWECLAQSAAYCDPMIAQSNGTFRRRFEHHNSYTEASSLNDVLSTMQRACRGYRAIGSGNKLQLIIDQARPTVFTFNQKHLLPGTWNFSDSKINSAPNQIRAKFRSLLVPAFSAIESISFPNRGAGPNEQAIIVTCYDEVPCVASDYVWLGGTGTNYDREWQLLNPQPNGLALNQFQLVSQGSDFPSTWYDADAPIPGVAMAGLSQSRFKERLVPFNHKAAQLGRGQIAPGVPAQRNTIPQDVDFGTAAFDQVERIAKYEILRSLGADPYMNDAMTTPYVTPPMGKLECELFAEDDDGNIAIAIRPGDRVTIDETVNFAYAGDYEVLEPLVIKPYSASLSNTSSGLATKPSGGTLQLNLGPYNPDGFPDESDLEDAGWYDVPDSDPESGSTYTSIPLADGGQLVFFCGGVPSGTTVQMPSGFSPTQFFGWTSPMGYIETGNDWHILSKCSINSNLTVALNYIDGQGDTWTGDSGYLGLSWQSTTSVVRSTVAQGTWIDVTLAGAGEVVGFGVFDNIAGDGSATIELPAGYSLANCIAVCFPYDNSGPAGGNHCHVISCTVSPEGVVTFSYKDSSGNTWYGPAQVFIFAWKNNEGTVTRATAGGVTWVTIPLPGGINFRIGQAVLSDQSYEPGAPPYPATLALPAGVVGSSLQAIVSPFSFLDDGNPSHGVRALYLDQNLNMNASLQDGEGHIKYGNGTVLAVLCE